MSDYITGFALGTQLHVDAATVPATPAAPTAVDSQDAQSDLSWTAPADGGSAILGYVVTAHNGGDTIFDFSTDPSTSQTIAPLTNGTPYTFTVVAVNAVGSSSASDPSNEITPAAGLPSADPQSITVASNAPHNLTLTGSDPGSHTPLIFHSGAATNGSVSGTNNTTNALRQYVSDTDYEGPDSFDFTVENTLGGISASATIDLTVVAATEPAQPDPPTASDGGDAQSTVTWTAPADGGVPINGYTVTSYGASPPSPIVVAGNVLSTVVGGLTNDTPYTFTVTASNDVGDSLESDPSNEVTPTGGVGPTIPIVGAAKSGGPSGLATLESDLGKTVEVHRVYITSGPTGTSGGDWDPGAMADWLDNPSMSDDVANGRETYMSFKLDPTDTAAGTFDGEMASAFAALESAGWNGVVIWYHEPEDNMSGAAFVAAYEAFAVQARANWSGRIGICLTASGTGAGDNAYEPSDFDVYCVDGYSFPGSDRDVSTIFSAVPGVASGLGVDWAITEFGVQDDTGATGGRPQWITDGIDWAGTNGAIAIMYFDTFDSVNNWHWELDGDTLSLDALASEIGV